MITLTPPVARRMAGALALVLALVCAATNWIYFTHPLEVECMEGSNWIEALAFREGRNPYRDPGLAFINMNHGPLDAPAKALLARALPWLEPWHVIRLPGLLLPLALVLALRRGAGTTSPLAWPWAAAVGLTAHGVILSTGNMVAAMGRSDALMLLLLVPLVPLGGAVFRDDGRARPLPALLAGALAAAAFLENFRTVIALGGFALIAGFDWEARRFRPLTALGRAAGVAALGAVAVFAVVLGAVFQFDATTYFRYSLGFFLSANGHGVSGLARMRDVVGPLLDNKVWLLLPAIVLAFLILRRRSLPAWVGACALGLPFAVLAGSYVANHLGAAGGLHYLAPVVLLVLLLWRSVRWDEARHGTVLLLALAVTLLTCNWRIVVNNTGLLWHTRREAAAFNQFVRELADRVPVESQDVHLFRTRLPASAVDMGFLSYLAREPARAAYYPDYAARFAAHEQRLGREPPAAIVVGDFPSAELAQRLRGGDYVLVRESPPRIYNAENVTRTRVYLRRAAAGPFAAVPNPAPQYRAW